MVEYFRIDYSGAPFELFSCVHIIAIIITLLTNPLMVAYFAWDRSGEARRIFRYGLATLLVLIALGWQVWYIASDVWSLTYALPLHVCGLSLYLCALMLLTRSQTLFEVCYFWGLAGATQALITPDVTIYGFPHFVFFHSFLSHGAIILSVIYMACVEAFRPSWRSITKVVLITTGYMALVALVNALTGGNYMFIARRPTFPSLIDYLGPWPWYVVALYGIGLVAFVVVYLPFALRDGMQRRKG